MSGAILDRMALERAGIGHKDIDEGEFSEVWSHLGK